MAARYAAPLADLRFVLYDVLDVENLFKRLPGCETATRDVVDAVLEEAREIHRAGSGAAQSSGDQEGCHFDAATASVTTPAGFKKAYEQYVENGWSGLTAPRNSADRRCRRCSALRSRRCSTRRISRGATIRCSRTARPKRLLQHGEDWQREAFLKPIIAGRWTGTMCLTEPHCGTDLGLLKTKAAPGADGTYRISGTKIFITAGEHDFTENIVHLVLARLPDAPAGVKGISLFIVPKFKVGRDGQARRSQRARLRCDRAQDGHQGFGDLHDEFRRRRRLADRPAEQGPQCDVHDDEHRTARGRVCKVSR